MLEVRICMAGVYRVYIGLMGFGGLWGLEFGV